MPRKPKYKLKIQSINLKEFGIRIAKFRKEKGYTQVELAKKIGITQVLVSAYECGRIKAGYEIIAVFAQALEITADELLGLTQPKEITKKPNRKMLKRMIEIEQLTPSRKRIILQLIDNYLKGAKSRQKRSD